MTIEKRWSVPEIAAIAKRSDQTVKVWLRILRRKKLLTDLQYVKATGFIRKISIGQKDLETIWHHFIHQVSTPPHEVLHPGKRGPTGKFAPKS